MLTRRDIYTLSYRTILIGPQLTFGRFLKGAGYVRGRPTRVELAVGPNGALESFHISDIMASWSVAKPEQIATIELLFDQE